MHHAHSQQSYPRKSHYLRHKCNNSEILCSLLLPREEALYRNGKRKIKRAKETPTLKRDYNTKQQRVREEVDPDQQIILYQDGHKENISPDQVMNTMEMSGGLQDRDIPMMKESVAHRHGDPDTFMKLKSGMRDHQ